jgi:hypothetical protein
MTEEGWQALMKDIMATNPRGRPSTAPFVAVFPPE